LHPHAPRDSIPLIVRAVPVSATARKAA